MRSKRVPEVRFAGFTEDWEERKLGDLYTERKEQGNDSLEILSVSIHHGVSNEELDNNTLGKEVRRSEDKSLYKHVYFGDLVLNMMRAWQGAIGVVKSEGMVSPAYITAIPSTELYPLFMDYCLRRYEMISQMDSLSYGVTDFRKRLYWDSFIKVLSHIPSVPEQKRITDFFKQLDNTIALHEQELTTLKQTKQGFLQKMFPKEGESAPQVRFPGFTGDWENYRLSDIGSTFTGLSGKTKEDFGSGNGRFVTYMNVFANVIAKKDSSWLEKVDVSDGKRQNKLVEGDLLFTTSSETPEEVGMVSYWGHSEDNVYLNSFCFGFRITAPGIDPLFLAYLLRSSKFRLKITNLAQGSTRYNLSKVELLKLMLEIPSIEEQTQIAAFFKQLDDLIALHQRELDALKEMKKAFLQKMFV